MKQRASFINGFTSSGKIASVFAVSTAAGQVEHTGNAESSPIMEPPQTREDDDRSACARTDALRRSKCVPSCDQKRTRRTRRLIGVRRSSMPRKSRRRYLREARPTRNSETTRLLILSLHFSRPNGDLQQHSSKQDPRNKRTSKTRNTQAPHVPRTSLREAKLKCAEALSASTAQCTWPDHCVATQAQWECVIQRVHRPAS